MDLPHFEGWHLIGAFPDHEPDDVGSWLLVHAGEALLLEVPPGLTVGDVRRPSPRGPALALRDGVARPRGPPRPRRVGRPGRSFPGRGVPPPVGRPGDRLLHVGGEPVWLVKAPKHSATDVVTVFRGRP